MTAPWCPTETGDTPCKCERLPGFAPDVQRSPDEQRPVLMTLELADVLGLVGRMENGDGMVGVVWADESDLLAKAPEGAHIDWGQPDAHGRFTPTVHAGPRE